jgi:hypothetical protein
MATHEFVVPKSIPITSPASAPDDCHLFIKFMGASDVFPCVDRIIMEAARPLRMLSCSAIVVKFASVVDPIMRDDRYRR